MPECINYEEVREIMIFPEKAFDAEGKVGIILLIDTSGNVTEVGVLTGPEVFFDEVRRVSMFLKFTSAVSNGKKVSSRVTIYYYFKIV